MKICPRCKKSDIDESMGYCPDCGMKLSETIAPSPKPVVNNYIYNEPPKKKKHPFLRAIAAFVTTIILLLALVGVVGIFIVAQKRGKISLPSIGQSIEERTEPAVIYYDADALYSYDAKKDKTTRITKLGSDYSSEYYNIADNTYITSDGKYAAFIKNMSYENTGVAGTLSYSVLSVDEDKREDILISDNVSEAAMLSNNELIYETSNGVLYSVVLADNLNDTKIKKLGTSVASYYIDKDKSLMFFYNNLGDGYVYYSQDEEASKVADDINYIEGHSESLDKIYYTNTNTDLYVIENLESAKQIENGISYTCFVENTGDIYFVKGDRQNYLEDFIINNTKGRKEIKQYSYSLDDGGSEEEVQDFGDDDTNKVTWPDCINGEEIYTQGQSLYFYSNGTTSHVADNVFYTDITATVKCNNNRLLYAAYEPNKIKKLEVDEIPDSLDQLKENVNNNIFAASNYYMAMDSSAVSFDIAYSFNFDLFSKCNDVYEDVFYYSAVDKSDDTETYFTYMDKPKTTYKIEYSKDGIVSKDKLAENDAGYVVTAINGKYVSVKSNLYIYDVYINGESVAKNVLNFIYDEESLDSPIDIIKDTYIDTSSVGSGSYVANLGRYENGSMTEIKDSVSGYSAYADGHFLLLCDYDSYKKQGDLYYWNGETDTEPKLIASNVAGIETGDIN